MTNGCHKPKVNKKAVVAKKPAKAKPATSSKRLLTKNVEQRNG